MHVLAGVWTYGSGLRQLEGVDRGGGVGWDHERVGNGSERVGNGSKRVGKGSERVENDNHRVRKGIGPSRVGNGDHRVGNGSESVGNDNHRVRNGNHRVRNGNDSVALGRRRGLPAAAGCTQNRGEAQSSHGASMRQALVGAQARAVGRDRPPRQRRRALNQ